MSTRKADKEKANEILNKLFKTPICNWDGMEIAVAIPMERTLSYPYEVVPFIAYLGQRGAHFIWHPYARVDVTRNHMVDTFLESTLNFTHLLFLDSDMKFPIDIVEQLAKWFYLYDDVEVVAAKYFARGAPYMPCWFNIEDGALKPPTKWDEGLVEADAIGTGAVLISRRVFEKIDKPWFEYIYDEAANNRYPAEDIYFSLLCKEKDIKMWVDTELVVPHLHPIGVVEKTFRLWYERFGWLSEAEAAEKFRNEYLKKTEE